MLVPAPVILAPILFNKSQTFFISGSHAALVIVVIPFAFVAAKIILIVAPTLANSKSILVPTSFLASIVYLSFSSIMVAPSFLKPSK